MAKYIVITYAEEKELKHAHDKLARFRPGELPDYSVLDPWIREWFAKKGYDAPTSWATFSVHVVPTEEHKKAHKGTK